MLQVIVKYFPTGSIDNYLSRLEAIGWFCGTAKQTYYNAETDSVTMQNLSQDSLQQFLMTKEFRLRYVNVIGFIPVKKKS